MEVGVANAVVPIVRDEICEKCQMYFVKFLEEFRSNEGNAIYQELAEELLQNERNVLLIDFQHIENANFELAKLISVEYYRVYPSLCSAVKNFSRTYYPMIPPKKDVYVGFTNVGHRLNIRNLTASTIGSLLRISGQVVRTHPVHPELVSGVFRCMDCNSLINGVEQQFKYTQPGKCNNPLCNNRTRFHLDVYKSVFVDYQKVRCQETQAELPRGCIPRSLDIIVRAEVVEMAQPGDRCDFTGTLIVVPDVSQLALPGARAESSARHRGAEGYDQDGLRGLKALGVRDLNYKLAFLACWVEPTKPRFGGKNFGREIYTIDQLKEAITEDDLKRMAAMSEDKQLYRNLINSMFPSIHGNEEIKRGILLMLFGGVPKITGEKTTLRGDINVCVVGDPSTAKSHFLKQVEEFSPRAVYTSGKASSAAGLTAAVVRDEESSEFVIEAGALMLADNGVCCIDEFDKMDPRDQVAIHEAMEQQTISIAKAGVKATLNARTSILAAANPIGGRYDRSRSLRQNINLSAPILSRFDLFFVVVDECNEITDYAIARRIVDLHRLSDEAVDRVYSVDDLQKYIMFARFFKPRISPEAAAFLVEQYQKLRSRDSNSVIQTSWRITVRQLESLIRLSEAMARMMCCDYVLKEHVAEAYRLLNQSIIRVEQPDIHLDDQEQQLVNDDAGAGHHEGDESGRRQTDDEQMDATSTTHEGDQTAEVEMQQSKLTITFEEYKTIANKLVLHLRREEERKEGSGEDPGCRFTELFNWYLEDISDQLRTVEQLGEMKEKVVRIINRLISHDNILIRLSRSEGEDGVVDESDPILVVHPNYVLEDV